MLQWNSRKGFVSKVTRRCVSCQRRYIDSSDLKKSRIRKFSFVLKNSPSAGGILQRFSLWFATAPENKYWNRRALSFSFGCIWTKVLQEALTELGITEAVWLPTRNGCYYQVYFPCDLYDNDPTLQFLQSKGIGVIPDTSVGYIPFSLFYCNEDNTDEDLGDDFVNYE